MVKSILDDLQKDGTDTSKSGQKNNSDLIFAQVNIAAASDPTRVIEQTRHLPDGLILDQSSRVDKPREANENTQGVIVLNEQASENAASLFLQDTGVRDDKTAIVADNSQSDVAVHVLDLKSQGGYSSAANEDTGRTQPMSQSAHSPQSEAATKVSHGFSRPLTKSSASLAASMTEAQVLQTENLRLAQTRILELEKEVEQLRQENELLASAGDIAKRKGDELLERVETLERTRFEELNHLQLEMNIYRENLVEKDKELNKAKQKIVDLDSRLAKDLKKIRVRERELENRLEISKMEKNALLRAKDDAILDLKNKIDQLDTELENYKAKCQDLGSKVNNQTDQLTRTVRALRLALTHLEAHDTTGVLTPLKKAE